MTKNQLLIDLLDEIKFKDKLNQQQIAERLQVSSQHLSDVKNGRFPLTDELRGRFYETFTYLRKNAEEQSDVTPLRPAKIEPFTETKSGNKIMKREDGKLLMQVPLLPVRALGSPADEFAALINDEDVEKMLFIVDTVHHGRYVAFKVEGDSMDDGTRDSFESGDIVLVRELARDKWLPRLHFRDWPYWVIVFGNNVRIKQIIEQDDAGNITLHSLNPSPEYTDFKLNLDEIFRLFNVIQKVPRKITYGV